MEGRIREVEERKSEQQKSNFSFHSNSFEHKSLFYNIRAPTTNANTRDDHQEAKRED